MNSTDWKSLFAGFAAFCAVSLHLSAQPSNDMFASSAQVVGTNITYYGTVAGATSEPGEPPAPATDTVWISWAAPCTGRANYFPPRQHYINVYTGTTLALLQPVTLNEDDSICCCSFLAVEGVVYNFQVSGADSDFELDLWISPYEQAVNDDFAEATPVRGINRTYFGPLSVLGATMEPGEPAHWDGIPEKSIWWIWQAPEYGTMTLESSQSLASNVMIAVYTGDAVGTLTLVAKGTNAFTFSAIAGQNYHIAGAVPTNAVGDILITGYLFADTSCHPIPGNLLREPSWEGTGILDAQYWQWSGPLGGNVGAYYGDCDGSTWPVLYSGASIWQGFSTIPGHTYAVRFAYEYAGSGADGLVQVLWDTNLIGVADLAMANGGCWTWPSFTATASNTTSQVTFLNMGDAVAMDDFSVVDQTAPPAIVTQPSSQSTESGGTAAFFVNARGSLPLDYQWFFQSNALSGETNLSLTLTNASTNETGDYFVTISNNFGDVTSAVVSLRVDAPSYPTIVLQPYGDTVAQGGYFYVGIAALGTRPLSYQWIFNGDPIGGATNPSLTFTNVQPTNGGVYQVVVTNGAGTVLSLPATLNVSQSGQSGGLVLFANQAPYGQTNASAPVFDLDGVTPLNGGCVAQLYAGPTLPALRAVGVPVPFETGFNAGYYANSVVTLPSISAGSNAIVQVRAWDPAAGATYEQARALGGKFGESELLQIAAGGGVARPAALAGLQSFSMQAGLPEFNIGVIDFLNKLPDGGTVWSLIGQSNSIYLVEEAGQDWIWKPYLVLTNTAGTVNFTNAINTNSSANFFRARILD